MAGLSQGQWGRAAVPWPPAGPELQSQCNAFQLLGFNGTKRGFFVLRKNSVLTAGLVALLASVSTAHAETMTLQQALGLAYQSNPQLQAQRAATRAADEEVTKADGGWRPNLSVTGTYGDTQNESGSTSLAIPAGHPRDVSVTLTQPVFNGRTFPQIRQANAAVRASRAQLTSVEQSVLLAAAKSYFDVMTNEAVVSDRRDNVALLESQLSMTEERAAVGDITRTDLDLVRARLNAARADVAFAESELFASRAAFMRVIGRPAETLESAPRVADLPSSRDAAQGRALAMNPELNAAREQQRALDYAVDTAFGGLLPSLTLQGQYQITEDRVARGASVNSTAVFAQLRIPIYQGGGEYALVRQAKENRNRAAANVHDVERQVSATFDAAWESVVAAQSAISLYDQQVQAAQSAYEGFLEGVKAGERSTFDLLNAAQEVVSARIALAGARKRYYENRFSLLATMGELTANALRLPVTLYDPQANYDRNAGRWIGFGE